MAYRSAGSVFAEYALSGEGVLYTPVAWGHVVKAGRLLVVERFKKDDPLRSGELVLPGGRRKAGENFLMTAQRETMEETGVRTVEGDAGKFKNLYRNAIVRPGSNVHAVIEPAGRIWFYYSDSGKRYTGKIIDLKPLTEPVEAEGQSKRPRYMPLPDVMDSGEGFTPACHVLLQIIGSRHGRPLLRDGDIEIEDSGFYEFLRTAPPE